jgi:hypothetical protein
VRGDIEETTYEKDGHTVYTTDLRVDRISVIPSGKGK